MEKIEIMSDAYHAVLPGQRPVSSGAGMRHGASRPPTKVDLALLLDLAKALIGATNVEAALRSVASHLSELDPEAVLLINTDDSGDSCYYMDAPRGSTCLELNHQMCGRVRSLVGSGLCEGTRESFALDGGAHIVAPFSAEQDGGYIAVGWAEPPAKAIRRRALYLLPLIAELAGVRLHSLLMQLHRDAVKDEQVRMLSADQERQVEALRVSEREKAAARDLAEHDDLTGLNNRRGFLAKAEQSLLLARRQALPCAVIFADVDGLKPVNDQLGHAVGDVLIRNAAQIFDSAFRHADVVGRVGGDEFAAFTFDNSTPGAIIDRIDAKITQFNMAGMRRVPLSLSIGVINCDVQSAVSLSEYLVRADQEMYRRKRHARVAGH